MRNLSGHLIYDIRFLRLLIGLQRWEASPPVWLQTSSARELFFRISESLLYGASDSKFQTLKYLNGRFTDRAMRQRVREFQMHGLIAVCESPINARTKQLIPSNKFVTYLNQHVSLQRRVCEQHMHLIDKSQ